MATLNTSSHGPSIKASYQKVVDASIPSQSSSTYAQWAVFSVQAPLANAFQQQPSKESILKVQGTGDGELADLIDDLSEGRIQFAFVKVRDPNTTLPKSVLLAWCGEGVPERTKGYFNSHLAAVANILRGYHIQITARSDADLDPQLIIQKVSDSSGSRYGNSSGQPGQSSLPIALPTRPVPAANTDVDADGWGADAPQITRSQLEKVDSAYKPTKVNMAELTAQKSTASPSLANPKSNPDVVKGGYQPITKVDIAAIRRDAQQASSQTDDRPSVVQGSYEPVGKVDIAAIKARAQTSTSAPPPVQAERLTSLPKPKVASRFGSQTFTGTKAPVPALTDANMAPAVVGAASRTFADQGGKTPAQVWAEKKAKQGPTNAPASPVHSQPSGGWQSSYSGKKWNAVQTTRTGTSNASAARSDDAADTEHNVSLQADGEHPIQAPSPPAPPVMASRPHALPGMAPRPQQIPAEEHIDLPPPPQHPRTPSPEPSASPVRIAMPISRTAQPEPIEAHEPDAITSSLIMDAISSRDTKPQADVEEEDLQARTAGRTTAASSKRAIVQYDYEKAEDNEIELKEGEHVINIEMVDDDWWLGQNVAGESGLFPSNYVTLVDEHGPVASNVEMPPATTTHTDSAPTTATATATAQYEYDAAEENELSFPDGAKISNITFPDEDWWLGEYNGQKGLFPANYVALDVKT